jgi:transcriptional regulator with XRE-family HTH domain
MPTATKRRARSAFGDVLREELDAKDGMSVRQLSRLLAVGDGQAEHHRRNLQRYISGEVSPSDAARDRIADALEIPRERFREDAERKAELDRVLDALAPLAAVLHDLAVRAKERAAEA